MDHLDKFKGIIVAFYAPYDDNGEISIKAAVKLAKFYKEAGVRGLYLNGSSGEGFLLNLDERKKVVEAVLDEFKGDMTMTMIVHVGAAATRESVELARHAEKMGADALSAVPSVFYRFPEASIAYHWSTIIDSTSLPFIIYNIPQLTGYDLTLNLLDKMIKNGKVIGVKNSSMSAFQIEQFKKTGGKDFIVFNGPDEQYLAGRIMGAQAGIGGTYGVMPELFLKLERCFVEGHIEEAQKWQIAINEIIGGLLSFNSLYGAAKAVLKLRGIDIGSVRAPMLPIFEADMSRLHLLHEKVMEYTDKAKMEQ